MQNHDRIVQAIQADLHKSIVLQKRYDATMALYQAACLENKGIECDMHRQTLHNILDLLLDTNSSVALLQRQMLSNPGF